MRLEKASRTDDTNEHKQEVCHMMSCIQVWYWTALSPSHTTAEALDRHHMHRCTDEADAM